MTVEAHIVASGQGWRVADVTCTAGRHAAPFEEEHAAFCIALVRSGTFGYRAGQGSAVLAPGAILLGNAGGCYTCGHEHDGGDRCLSFHFEPALFEDVVSGVPGARQCTFERAHLPPSTSTVPLLARLEAALRAGEPEPFEELGVQLAGAAFASVAGEAHHRPPSRRDHKRVADAVHRIERDPAAPISLDALAAAASTSRYHFLRCFRAAVGLSPYQFVLRTRLQHAAVLLLSTDVPIAMVALDSGFEDLSSFNRRFRSTMGMKPGAYRARRVKQGG